MSKLFVLVVFSSLFAGFGCATSATAVSTPASIEIVQEGGRRMVPGVKREGDVLVSVGCTPASFGVSLARTGAEARARGAAVRSVCPTGRANVVGSMFNDSEVVGNQFCAEVRTPVDGIVCLQAETSAERAQDERFERSLQSRPFSDDFETFKREADDAFKEMDRRGGNPVRVY